MQLWSLGHADQSPPQQSLRQVPGVTPPSAAPPMPTQNAPSAQSFQAEQLSPDCLAPALKHLGGQSPFAGGVSVGMQLPPLGQSCFW